MSKPNYQCEQCNSDNYYVVESVHESKHSVFCGDCDEFITRINSNIFANNEEKFILGEYKGKKIIECEDLPYLKWLSNLMKKVPKQYINIKRQIKILENAQHKM